MLFRGYRQLGPPVNRGAGGLLRDDVALFVDDEDNESALQFPW